MHFTGFVLVKGCSKTSCQTFARLSSPAEQDKLNLIGNSALDESSLLAIADALKWYGNPQSIPLLRQGIEHEKPKSTTGLSPSVNGIF